MDEKDFLRAIKLSKEELIEWLNEMYHDEELFKDIIREYEKACNTTKQSLTKEIKEIGKETKIIHCIECFADINGKHITYCKANWD